MTTSAIETTSQPTNCASEQSTVPNLGRAPRMPCQRDFEIFRMAEILGLKHDRIASVHRLTRRRVSQIVETVRDWLSNNPCEDPQLATELQRKRLAQHLERMRLEDCLERARMALDLAPNHLTTVHIKADGSETKTIRQQPPVDVQVLKTYLRAIQALGKFHQQPEVPYPPPAEGEFTWAKEAMNEVLARWYERIWSRSLKIEHFYDFAEELIGAFVKALRLQQPAAEEATDSRDQGDSEQEVDAPADDTQARSASEGTGSEDAEPSPESSTVSNDASLVSQREATASDQAATTADAATDSTVNTCAAELLAKTSSITRAPSQENLKREAPPPFSQSLCPSVALSSAPSPSPPGS